jgi:hypothetical protein
MAFYDQRRIAFSPSYEKQTSQGTALANGKMTGVFRATTVQVQRVLGTKIFRDCTNLYLRRRHATSLFFRIIIEFEASAHQIAGLVAGAMGIANAPTGTDPKTHALYMLPPSVRELSLHTFIVGHDDASGEGYKYHDAAIARIRGDATSGPGGGYWRCQADIVASGDRTAVTGWTWPSCIDEDPARLEDGTYLIGATDYIDQAKELFFEYDNAILVNDAPFVAGSIFPKRWLYGGAERGYIFGGSVIGTDRPGDTLNQLLTANTHIGTEVADSAMRIGTAGNGITFAMPSADATVTDDGQGYFGEAQEGVLNTVLLAKKVDGDAESPMSATAVIPNAQQATAFEVAA